MEGGKTFRFDLSDGRLWKGERPIQLGSKAIQLLNLLVKNPNRVMTKEVILDKIWADLSVTEGLVKEYIHDLRSVLGDDPKEPAFIETVHGQGYRYLGGIELTGPIDRREQINRPSIAVLPFTNMSGNVSEDYFADGLSEEIITALSFVPWAFVIARNSSFRYRGQDFDPRQIGEELGVRYILEGSIRRAESRLRVTVRLVDTSDAIQIWARRFEADLGEVFKLQDDIAAETAGRIGSEIQLAEIRRSSRKPPRDQTAYDLYLRARAALNGQDIQTAIELLDAAIARAPDYGRAMAVRAWCTTLIGWRFASPTNEQRKHSLRLAEAALASPDVDAETGAYAGYAIGFMSDQARRAISLLEDSTRQCPSFAWAWASLALMESYHGDPERAISHANTSLNLSPGDPQSFRCDMAICKALLVEGKFAECLNASKQGLAKSPSNAFLQMCRITCQVELGRLDDAKISAKRFLAEYPDFQILQWQNLTENWLAWESTSLLLCHALRAVGVPD